MKSYNIKNSIWLIVSISILVLLILALINGIELSNIWGIIKQIPNIVTIDLILISVFSLWGWKLKMFKGWLVPFNNLNGTWIGEICSSWINDEIGERVESIPAMLTIKQNFFQISCKITTKEMESHSIIEGFVIDKKSQINQLTYTYTSKPIILLQERSTTHEGSVILNIINKPDKKLLGKYWTDRKTNGTMSFDFYSNEIHEELPSHLQVHPMENNEW